MVSVRGYKAVINDQYPHYLYTRSSDEATQNEVGSYTTAGAAITLCGRCREETNGKGTRVEVAEGVYRVYTALIQMPAGQPRIPEGTEVFVTSQELEDPELLLDPDSVQELSQSGLLRISGENLKHDQGRLHDRIWV